MLHFVSKIDKEMRINNGSLYLNVSRYYNLRLHVMITLTTVQEENSKPSLFCYRRIFL